MASQELLNGLKPTEQYRKRDGIRVSASPALAPAAPPAATQSPITAVIPQPEPTQQYKKYALFGDIFAQRDAERKAMRGGLSPEDWRKANPLTAAKPEPEPEPLYKLPDTLHSNSLDILGGIVGAYGMHALRAWLTHREIQITTGCNMGLTELVKATPQRDDKTYDAIKNSPDLFSVTSDGIVYRTGEKRIRAKYGLAPDKWVHKLKSSDLKRKSTLYDAIVTGAINSLGENGIANLPTLEAITQLPRKAIQAAIKRIKAHKKANYRQVNTGDTSKNCFDFESKKSGTKVTAQRIANSYFLRPDKDQPVKTLRKRRKELLSEVCNLTTDTSSTLLEGNDHETQKLFTPEQISKRKKPIDHDHLVRQSHAITMRRNQPARVTQWWQQVVICG